MLAISHCRFAHLRASGVPEDGNFSRQPGATETTRTARAGSGELSKSESSSSSAISRELLSVGIRPTTGDEDEQAWLLDVDVVDLVAKGNHSESFSNGNGVDEYDFRDEPKETGCTSSK